MGAFRSGLSGTFGVIAALVLLCGFVVLGVLFLCGGAAWLVAPAVNPSAQRTAPSAQVGAETTTGTQPGADRSERPASSLPARSPDDSAPAIVEQEPARDATGGVADSSESVDPESAQGDDESEPEPDGKPDPAAIEKRAAAKLATAKQLSKAGKTDSAKRWLREIVDQFPDTEAANEAARLLKQ